MEKSFELKYVPFPKDSFNKNYPKNDLPSAKSKIEYVNLYQEDQMVRFVFELVLNSNCS